MAEKYSFKKGFGLVSHKDIKSARKDLMKAMNIKSRSQWYNRLNGVIIPNMAEAKKIESILKKYGVDSKSVWG